MKVFFPDKNLGELGIRLREGYYVGIKGRTIFVLWRWRPRFINIGGGLPS